MDYIHICYLIKKINLSKAERNELVKLVKELVNNYNL